MTSRMSRRQLMRLLGWGALGAAASGGGAMLGACTGATDIPLPPAGDTTPSVEDSVDLDIRLIAEPAQVQILAGNPTAVWRYRGEVLSGDAEALETLPDSYLGPTIRVTRGQRVRVHLQNSIDQETIVHWHGLLVPPEMDGHPRYVVPPGGEYVYTFEVRNRAGTYWYHPHPHALTGPQVYAGLAGLLLVSDAEEAAARLPDGVYDVPLVLQDRTFDGNNRLMYLRGETDPMVGMLGDRMLVNGRPDYVLDVVRRPYRLRLLNGSNARIYKLAWEDGTPLTVIGTDGGLLPSPVQRDYVTLGPAERLELWVDFARWPSGQHPRLVSLPFASTIQGAMMGQGVSSGALPPGTAFEILTVRIDRDTDETSVLPASLASMERLSERDAVRGGRPRTFTLAMGGMGMGGMGMGGMSWSINGRTFEMDEVAQDEIVQLGSIEAWQYDNAGGGMMGGMMQMAHPMHIHGVQFQVVERAIQPAFREAYETVSTGYVDEGWKDTVLVTPGEQVRVLMRFDDYAGVFLHHCHNLEHEDMGMMRNYRIDP